ncbi:hypothetical protein [Sphingosinicella sp. CPCC 101087]|uniref:hypothetical protein n=1 Tax=Sphingosinicella sp. CPCC 101087 TaxID=2497754 RepID=UPI0013EC837A|nr:hypothetical protein [Sphingosinicella sp. CPCC 101087]
MSALDGLIARVVEGQSAVRPITPPMVAEPEADEPWESEPLGEGGASSRPIAMRRESHVAADVRAARTDQPAGQEPEAKPDPEKAGREPPRSAPHLETGLLRPDAPDPVQEPVCRPGPEPASAGLRPARRPSRSPLEPEKRQRIAKLVPVREEGRDAGKAAVPRVEPPATAPTAPTAAVSTVPQAPAAPDRVTIEIGRIEVASPAPARARMLTLDDYRAARREGRR